MVKRIAAIALIMILPLVMSACIVIQVPPKASVSAEPTVQASAKTPVPSVLQETPAPSQTPAPPSPAVSIAPAVSTPNGPKLYSSYAHMTAYHPSTGLADFDYFDMLRGEDAVKWMVSHEGYTKAEAEEIVSEFADSEFIEKNENTQIRTIDLNKVALKLMYDPNGEMVTDSTPIASSVAKLNTLYSHDSSLVLDSFFYYVTVQNGAVVEVTQVYWP